MMARYSLRMIASQRATMGSGLSSICLLAILMLFLASCSPSIDIKTDRRALIIGISMYQDPNINDLSWPSTDADEMDLLLFSQDWKIKKLTDSQATRASIESEMENFFAGMEKDSTALIYYSGHGTLTNGGESGDPAIVPYNFSYGTWSPLITAIELSEMISEHIPTNNVIVIVDSCYSGGFVSTRDSSDVIPQTYVPYGTNSSVSALAALGQFGDLLAANAAEKGILAPIVISAAGSTELSYETSVLGNGVFTYYLLESAERGDANRDGFVTCTEAYTYAAKAIDDNWNRTSGSSDAFYPHISGGLRDLVLFTK